MPLLPDFSSHKVESLEASSIFGTATKTFPIFEILSKWGSRREKPVLGFNFFLGKSILFNYGPELFYYLYKIMEARGCHNINKLDFTSCSTCSAPY